VQENCIHPAITVELSMMRRCDEAAIKRISVGEAEGPVAELEKLGIFCLLDLDWPNDVIVPSGPRSESPRY